MAIVPDQLRHLVEDHPDEVAYRVIGAGELTFRRWDADASRLARGLMDRGLRVGDRVALLLEPTDALHHVRAHTGVHKAGGVNVAVNTRLVPGEIAAMLAHAEPRVLVASEEHVPIARKIADDVPSLELVVSTAPADEATAWDDVLADDDEDVQAPIDADSPADIIYTSGTTGRPKGVLTRHRNALQLPVDRPHWNGMGWFHASPMSTVAGMAFIYVPMRLGMTGVYLPRFDPRTFLDLAEAGDVQMAFLVPAMVELLLAQDDVEDRDLSAVNMVTVGAAPIAPSTLLRLSQLLPNGYVLNGFALTESGSAQVVLPADEVERRPGSVGRPMPPTEVRIVDDEGRPLPAGEVGEILLSNPGREREYYRDPEATQRTWKDGWLHTGDLGHVDDDGFLYIVGRKKDVIIRGGYNIHAHDVEAVLYEHEAVREAAVVGIPHPVLGEDVAAAVVVRDGADVSEDELTAWCADRLASNKVPRRVLVVDELPRNPTGKVLKDQLRDRLSLSS